MTTSTRAQPGAYGRRRAPQRRPPAPLPWVADAAPVVGGVGLLAVTALALADEPWTQITVPGGAATFVGSLTGLVGTYLALLMLLIVGRIPPLERAVGQDGLLRWHRRLAPWPITLIAVHAVAITLGYAQATRSGPVAELGTLISGYADVLAATVALGLVLLAGITSIRFVRRRLRRETWWVVHLYLYLALGLSFAHTLVLGPSFVGHPLTRIVWSAAWLGTAGVLLTYRLGVPLARSWRHRLRVVETRVEAPGVVSIIVAGRRLDRLPVAGGQWALWRFMARGLWWQAHPYSLSALPRPPHLRLTVRGVGDHSRALATIPPGTRIVLEGPYGAFRREAACRRLVALFAAGIGVTAVAPLLEDLPRSAEPVVVLRSSAPGGLALLDEIAGTARRKGGRVVELVGPRARYRVSARLLEETVPDIARREVYVCGPPGFVDEICASLDSMAFPAECVHHEAYAI